MSMTYCEFAPTHPVHQSYHDTEYGFPLRDDRELFERLILEINQAGLSWEIILKKRETFRAAYDGFDVERVAEYGADDVARLLADPGIIRNRLKVNAAITNAKAILDLRGSHGSFAGWLDAHHPLTRDEWRRLFKKTFVFTGGEIVNEFLMSLGYLPGAHDETCPIYAATIALNPPWRTALDSAAEAP
jgi:DNA-3-methyladenine glycosylase I